MPKLGVCDECNIEKFMHAKGLCGNCYKRIGTPKKECSNCNELKPHHAKGFCTRCYINLNHLDYIKHYQRNRKGIADLFKDL